MLTLESVINEKRRFSDYIFSILLEREEDLEVISDTIFLSVLGAKICYFPFSFLSLVDKLKSSEEKEVQAFLLNLFSKGHFSVFAHTPLYLSKKYYDLSNFKNIFKLFEDDNYYYLNLRHLLDGGDEEKVKLLFDKIDFSRKFRKIKHLRGIQLKYTMINEKFTSIFGYSYNLSSDTNRFVSIIFENISRVCSHQIVRHTYLNFNQKSHRYTPINEFSFFYIPTTISMSKFYLLNKIIDFFRELKNHFNSLNVEVKREDLRYFIPAGVETTLMASGWDWQWFDFISKRKTDYAQFEIKELAFFVEDILT